MSPANRRSAPGSVTITDPLAERVHRTAHLTGTFTLRSGATASDYFDKYQVEADPALLRAVAERMVTVVPERAEVLAGLELGGVPLVTMLAQLTGLPTCFVRKVPKTYGTARRVEGAPTRDRVVVLVEDVVATGGAVLDAAAAVRSEGGTVDTVVCMIDRESGGETALRNAGLELRAVFRRGELTATA